MQWLLEVTVIFFLWIKLLNLQVESPCTCGFGLLQIDTPDVSLIQCKIFMSNFSCKARYDSPESFPFLLFFVTLVRQKDNRIKPISSFKLYMMNRIVFVPFKFFNLCLDWKIMKTAVFKEFLKKNKWKPNKSHEKAK